MTRQYEAWPFVVTRNRDLDWRPICAPPAFVRNDADYFLVTATAEPAHPQELTMRDVPDHVLGPLRLCYRSVPLGDLLGQDAALDRFGRRVFAVEGFVIFGGRLPPGAGPAVSSALDERRPELERIVGRFWPTSDEEEKPLESAPVLVAL